VAESQARKDEQSRAAELYAAEGDRLYDSGDYVSAKVQYILARNIYSRIGADAALAGILTMIEFCDSRISAAPPTVTASADTADADDIAAEQNGGENEVSSEPEDQSEDSGAAAGTGDDGTATDSVSALFDSETAQTNGESRGGANASDERSIAAG
jgi:hypothetical protein